MSFAQWLSSQKTTARVPAGYPPECPMMIRGEAYVSGEFVPLLVVLKASAKERALLVNGGGEPLMNHTED